MQNTNKIFFIGKISLLFTLVLLSFQLNASVPSASAINYPRSLTQYLADAGSDEKIMVIGTTAGYRRYPANYYLINENKANNIDPDLTADITKANLFSDEYSGKFDAVVFEGLPGSALTQAAFQNAAKALKTGGTLVISNSGAKRELSKLQNLHGITYLDNDHAMAHFTDLESNPYLIYVSPELYQNTSTDELVTQSVKNMLQQKIGGSFGTLSNQASSGYKYWYKNSNHPGGLFITTKK